MPRFGEQLNLLPEQMELPLEIELPNCDDPVFRLWCSLCKLQPGQRVSLNDPRLKQLGDIFCNEREAEAIAAEDYLTPRGF